MNNFSVRVILDIRPDVARVIRNGIEEEVRSLLNDGVTLENQCMQGIGYKEVAESILSKEPFPSELVKMRSRRYAKRQITFFKKSENVALFNLYENNAIVKLFKIIDNFLNI